MMPPCECDDPSPVGVGGWLCRRCGKPTVVILNSPPSEEQMESSDDFEEE